jgi:hypothetical protein
LAPIQAKRAEITKEYIEQVLRNGNETARSIGATTLTQVKQAMNMGYPF